MLPTTLKYIILSLITVIFFSNFQVKADSQFDAHQQKTVSIIYDKWYSRPLHTLLTTTKWPSVIAGSFANSRLSALHIPGFIKQYSINVSEIEKPLSSFKTFNEFFIRTLKPESRPFSQEKNVVISPADGAILVIEHIGQTDNFPVKGTTFNLEKLLKSEAPHVA